MRTSEDQWGSVWNSGDHWGAVNGPNTVLWMDLFTRFVLQPSRSRNPPGKETCGVKGVSDGIKQEFFFSSPSPPIFLFFCCCVPDAESVSVAIYRVNRLVNGGVVWDIGG